MRSVDIRRHWLALITASLCGSLAEVKSLSAVTIYWDGGGDGVTWQDRFNWNAPLLPDPDTRPGLSDDVIIVNFASPIIVTGQASARTITCQGDITVQTDATLSVAAGMSLQGTTRLIGNSATNDGGTLYCRGTQTWTSATIVFDYVTTGRNPRILLEGNSTLTLSASVNVRGGSGSIRGDSFFVANGHLVNQGSISSDISGQSIGVSTASFTNAGSLTVSTGSTISLSGTWNNSVGTINIANGMINLGGTFTPTGLGTIIRTDGTIILSGTLDNTGSTFTLDANTGPWNFGSPGANATIKGGTFILSDPSMLIFSWDATLDGVSVIGSIDVFQNRTLFVRNGFALSGILRLIRQAVPANAGGSLQFENSQTMTSGTIFLDRPDSSLGGQGPQVITTAGVMATLGPAVTLRGGNGRFTGVPFSGQGTVINQGLISADVPGQALSISNFVNQGTMQAHSGSTLSLSGTWTNSGGTIQIVNGTLNLGSTFRPSDLGTISRTGGTINLTGTLDNTGSTFTLDANTGPWNFATNAVIRGGTLNISDSSMLVLSGNGTLDGASITGDVLVPQNRTLFVSNGLTLAGTIHLIGISASSNAGGNLQFTNSQTMSSGTVSFESPGSGQYPRVTLPAGVGLTLAPSVTVRGGFGRFVGAPFGGQGTLINQGLISADVPGQSLGTTLTGFTNSGVINIEAGSSVNVTGTYTQSSSGTLLVTIAGTIPGSQFGRMTISGQVSLDGTLGVLLANGFLPGLADTFQILTFASRIGAFSAQSGAEICSNRILSVIYNPADATLIAQSPSFMPGDLNHDSFVSLDDLDIFVSAILGSDTDPTTQARADMNCDGSANGLDVQGFVGLLIP